MNSNLGWLVYLFIGSVGGFLGDRFKIPAGGLIGAMMTVILFKLVTRNDWPVPKEVSFFFQVALGVMVGAAFHPAMLPHLKKLFLPIIASTISLVIVGLILALVFTRLQILDGPTAYLGTSPGAMSGIIVLAFEGGANVPMVLSFHFFRVVFVLLTAPLILKCLTFIKVY